MHSLKKKKNKKSAFLPGIKHLDVLRNAKRQFISSGTVNCQNSSVVFFWMQTLLLYVGKKNNLKSTPSKLCISGSRVS